MIHPFFTKLVSQPHLFAEHVAAYGELAAAEIHQFAAVWQMRAVLAIVSVFAALIAIVLSAVAGMFAAALAWDQMPAPWVLVAVPAAFWLITLVCGLRAWTMKVTPMFSLIRQQVSADIDLLNRAGNS